MDAQPSESAEEIKRLQRCINDLVSVVALPAMWSGADLSRIVHTLLDALLGMLHLDLVYLGLQDAGGQMPVEMVRLAQSPQPVAAPHEISEIIQPWFGAAPHERPQLLRKTLGGREISIVVLGMGLQGEIGLIAAGSERADFPRQTEKLVLNVAANQASVALQEARLRSEQKRIAEELDQRVAQRTAELAAANEALRKEISERREIEKRLLENETLLRKSEARLWEVVNTIPVMAWFCLPDGANEFHNKRWSEYTGLSPEDSTGSAWRVAYHPEDLPRLIKRRQEYMSSGEPGEIQARIRRFDGVYRWFLIRAEPFRDESGTIVRWYGTCTDVHDRKRTQDELQRSEEKYRVVVETASDAIISMNESGVIIFANAATKGILGYEPAELIGKSLTVLMPQFMRELHTTGFRRYLSTGHRHINWQGTELTALRKNGQEFPVEISFGELTSDGHKAFTGLIRDISKRKQADDQLRESERKLQMTQAELVRVSRLTTMGELAASIAHEVNQPLTAVVNNGSACLRLLANRNLEPDVLRGALEGIVADGTRASGVLARIRAFIRKEPAEKIELNINQVIQEVLVLAARELSDNQVSLNQDLRPDLPAVFADRVQLQQVLLNLIMNGIEAMTVVTNRPRLLGLQSWLDESRDIVVGVSDSGTGLGSEVNHVFTPFFTTKATGMGMGLSISRSLVESHGGRLWATPNSPHGAVFSFTLPANDGSPS
jgi:PAS domain S-box-containing protein